MGKTVIAIGKNCNFLCFFDLTKWYAIHHHYHMIPMLPLKKYNDLSVYIKVFGIVRFIYFPELLQSMCSLNLAFLVYTVMIKKSLVYCCGLSLLLLLSDNKGFFTIAMTFFSIPLTSFLNS